MKAYTLQDMERAWAEGHRTCYEGGGEESNPYIEKGRDASPKSVTATTTEPHEKETIMNDSTRPATHPEWCNVDDCEFYNGAWDHSGIIKSGLTGAEGQEIEAGINMRDGSPIIALYGIDDDFGRDVAHVARVAAFLTEVCKSVEAGVVQMSGRKPATVGEVGTIACDLGVQPSSVVRAWEAR